MLMLTLYKRDGYSGKTRMIKGDKHLIFGFMRFGWLTNNILIFILEAELILSQPQPGQPWALIVTGEKKRRNKKHPQCFLSTKLKHSPVRVPQFN